MLEEDQPHASAKAAHACFDGESPRAEITEHNGSLEVRGNVLVGRSLSAVVLVCPVHAVVAFIGGEGVIDAVVDLGHVVAGLVGVEVAMDQMRTAVATDFLSSVIYFLKNGEHV